MQHRKDDGAPIARVARGVYWARYTKKGRPIAYAVDSHGDVVRRYVVMHDSRCEAAVQALWSFLDVVDPDGRPPQLHLVKDVPVRALPNTVRRRPLEVFDPYNAGPLPGPIRLPDNWRAN